MRRTRRRFVAALAGVASAVALPAVAGSLLTPRQPAGPFYPDELPLDDDNDLVRVRGRDDVARGQITDLTGRLLDRQGRPLNDVRIEIWQCDANGRYRHPRDPGARPVDPAFQGFGHAVTDDGGRYRFRTIRPVPYPGRAPHIHVAVYPFADEPFVTQLYVAGEPRNANDFLYRRMASERRSLVTAEFVRSVVHGAELAAHWDIVLGVSA